MKNGKLVTLFRKIKGMWSKPPEGRFLTFKEMLYFGGTALGISLFQSAIFYVVTAQQIPYAYGIANYWGYTITLIAATVNTIIQPIIGRIMDVRTTKYGKYKPFILFIIPFASVLGVMATWVPQIGYSQRVLFACLTCIPALVLSGILGNMMYTMPNVMTPVSQERTDMMTPIGLIIGFAPSVLQIIAGPIRTVFINRGAEYLAFRYIGLIGCVLSFFLTLFILRVKERVYVTSEEAQKKENVSILQAFKLLFKNTPLLIFSLSLCFTSFRDFSGAYFQYVVQFRYFETVTQGLNWSGLFLSIVGFASTVGMVTMPFLTRWFSKRTVLILWSAFAAVANFIFAVVGYENIPIGLPSAIICTVLRFISIMSAMHLIAPLMMGELCDYQQWKTGKRLEGYIQMFCFSIPNVVGQGLVLLLVTAMTKKLASKSPTTAIKKYSPPKNSTFLPNGSTYPRGCRLSAA
jgi:Na+/melibiose symporter and related transporters